MNISGTQFLYQRINSEWLDKQLQISEQIHIHRLWALSPSEVGSAWWKAHQPNDTDMMREEGGDETLLWPWRLFDRLFNASESTMKLLHLKKNHQSKHLKTNFKKIKIN